VIGEETEARRLRQERKKVDYTNRRKEAAWEMKAEEDNDGWWGKLTGSCDEKLVLVD
jgi:hypothetical protein